MKTLYRAVTYPREVQPKIINKNTVANRSNQKRQLKGYIKCHLAGMKYENEQ